MSRFTDTSRRPHGDGQPATEGRASGGDLRPSVIAHRGLHTTGATENTLAAFKLALDAGAAMIELDVRRTGDGQLAVLHDHGLRGVALDSCSLEEFSATTGLRPPLLDEVLEWADGRIGLDVELKEDGYVEQTVGPLQAFAAAGNELLVTSFLDPVLARLHELAPELRLGLLLHWSSRHAVERARAVGAAVVVPEMKLVNEQLIAEVSDAGLELIAWDFMVADHGWLLADTRVRAVITDDVSGAVAALT